jgi:hypothetical protein
VDGIAANILECGDMSPLSKRGHVRALQSDADETKIQVDFLRRVCAESIRLERK